LKHSVTLAIDGQQALDFITNPQNHFDLVILDWIMPRLNGLEVLEKTLKLFPDFKIIVSSGFGSDKRLSDKLKEYSKIKFLTKPYTPEELLELISELQSM